MGGEVHPDLPPASFPALLVWAFISELFREIQHEGEGDTRPIGALSKLDPVPFARGRQRALWPLAGKDMRGQGVS